MINANNSLGDQNTDNIEIVSNILNGTVALLSNTTLDSSQVLMVWFLMNMVYLFIF